MGGGISAEVGLTIFPKKSDTYHKCCFFVYGTWLSGSVQT